MADSRTRRIRQMEHVWAIHEHEKRKAQRQVFLTQKASQRAQDKDYKAKARASCNFLSMANDVLRLCSIVGTVLNGARKVVMSGDYDIAREHFDKAFHYYTLLGGQFALLERHLDRTQGFRYEPEKDITDGK